MRNSWSAGFNGHNFLDFFFAEGVKICLDHLGSSPQEMMYNSQPLDVKLSEKVTTPTTKLLVWNLEDHFLHHCDSDDPSGSPHLLCFFQ